MKYSASNKPLVCMQTQSTCYKGTDKMKVKGVLWHSTAANNPTLKRYVQPSDKKPAADTYSKAKWLEILGKNKYNNDMNHIERKMGMNAWIGELADGTVTTIQTMPWDYRPWGCASGKKGSCNSGWIQFEICEDDLTDKKYFEAVYKEACEFTAYICDMYNLDPKGSVMMNGVKVPVILCHQDSYKLGLGNNHGDVYHWFKKYGKDMNDVRNDVAKILADNKKKPEAPKVEAKPVEKKEEKAPVYTVRRTWIDTKTKAGDFVTLDEAKKAREKAGSEYEVYEIKTGALIYPLAPGKENFTKGDIVKILPNSTWSTGASIPKWVYSKKLYVREIYSNGIIAVSTLQTGAITGTIKPQYLDLSAPSTTTPTTVAPTFNPYLIIVNTNSLNVRGGPGTQYGVNTTVKKGQVYTIIAEQNGWGKLKSGAGWISLNYTKKL